MLGDIPEAGTEGGVDQQAVIFFRVSKAFKTSIENAAKESETSVNAWLLRACETVMQDDIQGRIEEVSNFLDMISAGFKECKTKNDAMTAVALSLSRFILVNLSARLLRGDEITDAIVMENWLL